MGRRQTPPAPPRWAERLLELLVAPEEREAVLGDFLEEFRGRTAESGRRSAAYEYWREVLISLPHLLRRRLERSLLRRGIHMDTKSGVRQALLGLVLIAPALLLVITGVLQSAGVLSEAAARGLADPATGLLRGLYHPAVILGGLLLAFALNVRPVLRVDLKRHAQTIVGTVTVRGRLWNLISVGLALALLGGILGYAFVENYKVVPTHVAAQPLATSGALTWERTNADSTVLRFYDAASGSDWVELRILGATPVSDDP
ncbi:MAG: permease prefix domain 2-containing transporter [Anaerolineales bacterium]